MKATRRAAVIACCIAASCQTPPPQEGGELNPYEYQLADGEYGIERLPSSGSWPDLSIGWQRRNELIEATQRSMNYLTKPSSKSFFPVGPGNAITHDLMSRSVARFNEVLHQAESADDFLKILRREFDVWIARGRSSTGDVFFTGYGTPILDGARSRGGEYQYPLYGPPDDLAKTKSGEILGRKTAAGKTVPYYTSAELQQNKHLEGLEIVWLKNPYDAYMAHVQGSAVIRFSDGELFEVGYAGNNGHDYNSIGIALVEEGKFTIGELSLQKLRDYFANNEGEAERVLPKNPRFVFFQGASGGPYGCLGQPVTAMHSVATDKDIFPRAAVVYIEARLPEISDTKEIVQRPVRFFALDQDRGGAIRSAGRCDIYMGLGDEAMARAGHVQARGRMYYLLLKQ
ncbi:MAG: MltA domain-containing protein [Planctomycetota bacterium]|jgi:membrane-bound lytic murein transglycosylase A|nr:MltA domain-containing protein [Planctomycetota bacterium]